MAVFLLAISKLCLSRVAGLLLGSFSETGSTILEVDGDKGSETKIHDKQRGEIAKLVFISSLSVIFGYEDILQINNNVTLSRTNIK